MPKRIARSAVPAREDTFVPHRQGHHVLVARVPQELFLALPVDDKDLAGTPGGGVGSGGLRVVKQRPDMFRRQLGERSTGAGLAVDSKDATARSRSGEQPGVGPGDQCGDPGRVDFGQLLRLAGAGRDRQGKDSPLVASTEICGVAVRGQGHTPGKSRIQRQARRLHARDHFAGGQHHAGSGLAFLEILGRALAKKTRRRGQGHGRDQQPGGCDNPGKA